MFYELRGEFSTIPSIGYGAIVKYCLRCLEYIVMVRLCTQRTEPAQMKAERAVEAATAVYSLKGFMPRAQLATMIAGTKGEEGEFFASKLIEIAERIATMPKTYEQDSKGDQAIVSLHYFVGSCDWYITERDIEAEQHQAFGLANLGYGGELGYISIVELIANGAELDLHFTPRTLAEINAKEAV